MIDLNSIIIDAKSGATGAGRTLDIGTHFTECNETTKAYKIASHRHTPEIEQELSELAGQKIQISFTPHLIPMQRGILATCYANLKDSSVTYEEIKEVKIYRRLKTGQNPSTFKNNLIRSLKFPKSIQRETKKITLEIKPDIIHFIGTSIIAAPKLRSLGIPLFATIESYPTLCPKGDRWYRGKEECKVVCSLRQFVPCQSHSKEIGKMKNKWYLKYNPFFLLFVYNHYQKLNQALQHCQLIAISDYVKNLLIQQGHASTVIPNALDLKPFQKAQKKGKDNAGKPRILFLGSLMESKGPQVLLEAIKGINCRCDLYGEGAMKEQLQQIIDQNAVKRTETVKNRRV